MLAHRPGMTARESLKRYIVRRSMVVFTTLLTGNGLSAAFSVLVPKTDKKTEERALLCAFPTCSNGRTHA